MAIRSLVESFNSAIEGFVYVFKTQRNMRFHFYLAVLVIIIAGLFFNRTEVLILSCTVCLVLLAEMINTACELAVDMVTDSFHPIARIIKDIAAGAVFLTALNAVIVGYIIFSNYLPLKLESSLERLRSSPGHLTFIAFVMVMTLVLISKIWLKKGTPFRGGMPSGHAALSFSFWTVILLLSESGIVTILSFLMASLIAASRIRKGLHTPTEVIIGSLGGIMVTSLIFGLVK